MKTKLLMMIILVIFVLSMPFTAMAAEENYYGGDYDYDAYYDYYYNDYYGDYTTFAYDNANYQYVFDLAFVMTEEERLAINEVYSSLSEELNYGFLALTRDVGTPYDNLSWSGYAAYLFNDINLDESYASGVLVVSDWIENTIAIYPYGDLEYLLDTDLDSRVFDAMVDLDSNADYDAAFIAGLSIIEAEISNAPLGDDDTASLLSDTIDIGSSDTVDGRLSSHIIDEVGLLSADQLSQLEAKAAQISSTYNSDINLIISDNLQGQSLEAYIEFHEAVDTSADGVVFGHSPAGREFFTIGRGFGYTAITSQALARIDKVIIPYLQDDDFYGAYAAYLDEISIFYEAAAAGTPYDIDIESEGSLYMSILIALIGGIIIAFLVTGSMKAKMNTAVIKKQAADYVRSGSFQVQQSYDRFLYENTTRTRKQESKSSGGGSRGGRGGGKY